MTSATLRLNAGSSSSGRTIQAHRLTATWAENSVTWANQPATNGTPATTTSGNGWRQWTVTTHVQAMYDTAAPHGFLIRDAAEGGNGSEQSFRSREGATAPGLSSSSPSGRVLRRRRLRRRPRLRRLRLTRWRRTRRSRRRR